MAGRGGKPFMHGSEGRSGRLARSSRKIGATESEWDTITAAAEREGVGISECIHNRFRRPGTEAPGDRIPIELELEALVDIIHLHALFERQYGDEGKAEDFEGMRDQVRRRFSPAIYEALIPEDMKREGFVAMLHLHTLFRTMHDRSGKGALFEGMRDEVDGMLQSRGLLGPGSR